MDEGNTDRAPVNPFLVRLVLMVGILLVFGKLVPSLTGFELFDLPKVWLLIPAVLIYLIRRLRSEERPYDQLETLGESEESADRVGAKA